MPEAEICLRGSWPSVGNGDLNVVDVRGEAAGALSGQQRRRLRILFWQPVKKSRRRLHTRVGHQDRVLHRRCQLHFLKVAEEGPPLRRVRRLALRGRVYLDTDRAAKC